MTEEIISSIDEYEGKSIGEPFELMYYKACINKRDAFEREKYLKSGP